MARTLHGITLALIASAFTAVSALAAGPITLQLNLKVGDSYTQRVATTQKISQTIMGKTQSNDQNMVMTYTFKIKDKTDKGVAIADATYDQMTISLNGGPVSMTYDSTDPKAKVPAMLKPYSKMIGKTFTVKIAPDGTIPEVTGMEKLFNNALDELKLEGKAREQAKQLLEQQFGADNVRSLFEQTLAIYPDKPVKTGDSWSRKIDASQVFPMVINNTWTLDSYNDKQVVLKLTSTLLPTDAAKSLTMQGMQMAFDFKGKQDGSITLDRTSGWIQKENLDQSLDGTMAIKGPPQMPQDMKVPVTMKSTVEIDTGDQQK